MTSSKQIIILTILTALAVCQKGDKINYIAYTSKNTGEPNDLFLKQGPTPSGNCRCLSRYNGVHFTGCFKCPSGCFKYRTGGINYACGRCISHCSRCDKISTCNSCNDGYYGSYCAQCQVANCQRCTGSGINCKKCNSGYFFNGRICDSCMAHCGTCKNKTTCETCAGFYEWNEQLQICKEMPFWKKFLIWIGIILFLMVAGVCLCVCCVCSAVDEATGRRRYGRRKYYDDSYGSGGFNGNFSDGNEQNIGYGGQY